MSLSPKDIDRLISRWKACQKHGTLFSDVYIRSKLTCSECNAPISKVSKTGLCLKCLSLRNRKCERPSKEKLLHELQTSNFTKVGAKYGVSDNAIRKWCRSYNLPTKVHQIKTYNLKTVSCKGD